jgi:hypothetical protein
LEDRTLAAEKKAADAVSTAESKVVELEGKLGKIQRKVALTQKSEAKRGKSAT